MIMRSASSLDLNLRAAQKPSVPRVISTARLVSASPRVAKSITRASSDGNLYKIQSPESSRAKTISVYHEETASYKVLEGSRLLPQGGSNGGFGGPRCGDGAGGGGGGGSGGVDSYYEDMIQRYPGDTLLLSNYARFLKEVKGDGRKAEEYCERAMLSENGRDGEMLSMYGDLIWQNHGDGVRAHSYFDQAVQSSPDDCHVLASYARFLWDAEEEEEEEESKLENAFSSYNPSVSVVS
ncbi:PREDICTED: probable monogalactosyldiacylglycerol synthase 1, chloroplastic isoform X2 [Camelina sativa]|uniref:Probable monogalactosyldiacylglycerol synthase 1, chloroplastic isoform X2 n=1 Tax=Camelina sativa TaxID=90675 RepID=A0ABM1QQ32_CAMSA|nr:PREDICTED: probable monogalactosyldiacylglycerol synthase 1, chloroplastic isoform X2 [Camelina sativa]